MKEGRKESCFSFVARAVCLPHLPSSASSSATRLPSFLEATGYRLQIHRSDSSPSSSRSPGHPANSHPIDQSSCSCLLQQIIINPTRQTHPPYINHIRKTHNKRIHPPTPAGLPLPACRGCRPIHPSITHEARAAAMRRPCRCWWSGL